MTEHEKLTPALLLAAYAQGYFPMAASRNETALRWYRPDLRGVLPLEGFRVPKSLAKAMRASPYRLTMDTAFESVIRACADTRAPGRDDSWINDEIVMLYTELARLGHAHSVECWHDDELMGGLYGVSLGRAFFGESMFSRAPNASKIALVHLVDWLKREGYTLLDTQYVNPHLLQFGVVEVPGDVYRLLLDEAISPAIGMKS